MSALLLALHTGLRTKVTHTSGFFCLLFFVRTFHIYRERERQTGRQTDRQRTSGSAGLLASVYASAVPYSRESEERT